MKHEDRARLRELLADAADEARPLRQRLAKQDIGDVYGVVAGLLDALDASDEAHAPLRSLAYVCDVAAVDGETRAQFAERTCFVAASLIAKAHTAEDDRIATLETALRGLVEAWGKHREGVRHGELPDLMCMRRAIDAAERALGGGG